MICNVCKEPYEDIDVNRTKYFLIQFPLLFIGVVIIAYSLVFASINPERLAEFLGYFIMGISLLLFALAFQITDNKNMELQAKEIGISRFSHETEEEVLPDDELATSRKRTEQIKEVEVAKTESKPTSSASDLFLQPNKPSESISSVRSRILKTPTKSTERIIKRPTKAEEPIQIKSLKKMIRPEPEKKKARKIRRAI